MYRNLLSSPARIQVPWIKVTIGNYTFGVFTKTTNSKLSSDLNYGAIYNVQYPNFVKSLTVTKINGQINQYTLNVSYPVTANDDPNFFDKVLSSVSKTRKIIFSYGDMSTPSFAFKDEEAIITKVTQQFSMTGSVITYVINATSSSILNKSSNWTFPGGLKQPSVEIKRLLSSNKYGLTQLFTGMNKNNIDKLIAGDDKLVEISTKKNISALDYVMYLVNCMIPKSSRNNTGVDSDIYVFTIHDDSTYEKINESLGLNIKGPYFKVSRISHKINRNDAFTIDLGFGNSGTIVTNFSIDQDENYSMLYDYTSELNTNNYVQRLDNNGKWQTIWSPSVTSKNDFSATLPEDLVWWTKMTKYPIKATITVQGLLRPALLMSYLKLNVIFPGGRKHNASGTYLITQQIDSINEQGYKTTLSLVRIIGDDSNTI